MLLSNKKVIRLTKDGTCSDSGAEQLHGKEAGCGKACLDGGAGVLSRILVTEDEQDRGTGSGECDTGDAMLPCERQEDIEQRTGETPVRLMQPVFHGTEQKITPALREGCGEQGHALYIGDGICFGVRIRKECTRLFG